MADSEQAVAFLSRVWGNREGYVDLPSKTNGHWIPFSLEWPNPRLARRRIDSCLEDGEDVYFSVAQFSSRGRRIADVLPPSWLWADLDSVTPAELVRMGVRPTILWESSPGRYQCLWQLKEELRPKVQSQLNRLLSYKVDADRGGWDLTQVLRPPGTQNHKYSEPVVVSYIWDDGPKWSTKKLYRLAKSLPEPVGAPRPALDLDSVGGSRPIEKAVIRDQVKMPARARRLLNTPPDHVVEGERSSRLWELECLLAEAGYSAEEMFDLIWPTPWNKWKELNTGDERLTADIQKALRRVAGRAKQTRSKRVEEATEQQDDTPKSDTPRPLPLVAYADFLSASLEAPRWMIEDIWGAHSHGFIGGEPKTSKSTLAFAMGVAVASGRPFLGQYPVRTSGPVLVIQEENAPWMVQDRLRKIARHSGLIKPSDYEQVVSDDPAVLASKITRLAFPDEIPLYLLNNYGWDITDYDDREALEAAIQAIRPAMVIFDPLYLIAGATNLNSQQEIQPLLKWFLYLRYTYNCAVVVVHHMSKASSDSQLRRPGQRLMGSGLFHGFVESALYAEKLDDSGDWTRVKIEREFRNTKPQRPLEISLRMGEPGDLEFEAEVIMFDPTGEVLSVVEQAGVITLAALAEMLGCDKRTARRRATEVGCRVVGGKRGRGHTWTVYPPGSEPEGEEAPAKRGAKEGQSE